VEGKPILIMLAGPNGAGKSTFHKAYLADLGLPFLNADVLAEQWELDSYSAAQEVARLCDAMVRNGESFITETVLSDPVGAKVSFLRETAEAGYDVELIFIGIENPEMSRDRVGVRVEAGGHDVPLDKIQGRYPRTLENLRRAIQQLPKVLLYDNSSYKQPHRLIGEFQNGQITRRGEGPVPAWAREFVE
jgi:predicted ABC-type ATPase